MTCVSPASNAGDEQVRCEGARGGTRVGEGVRDGA
jgi:hypothetical protein